MYLDEEDKADLLKHWGETELPVLEEACEAMRKAFESEQYLKSMREYFSGSGSDAEEVEMVIEARREILAYLESYLDWRGGQIGE